MCLGGCRGVGVSGCVCVCTKAELCSGASFTHSNEACTRELPGGSCPQGQIYQSQHTIQYHRKPALPIFCPLHTSSSSQQKLNRAIVRDLNFVSFASIARDKPKKHNSTEPSFLRFFQTNKFTLPAIQEKSLFHLIWWGKKTQLSN